MRKVLIRLGVVLLAVGSVLWIQWGASRQILATLGGRIVARNVRAGGVEIDLIATRGRLVAFVEVKTRRSARFGRPEEAVDAAKRAARSSLERPRSTLVRT